MDDDESKRLNTTLQSLRSIANAISSVRDILMKSLIDAGDVVAILWFVLRYVVNLEMSPREAEFEPIITILMFIYLAVRRHKIK